MKSQPASTQLAQSGSLGVEQECVGSRQGARAVMQNSGFSGVSTQSGCAAGQAPRCAKRVPAQASVDRTAATRVSPRA